jgi:hypothetical protein
MFTPHRAHLLVRREFTARGGGFRNGDCLALGLCQRHGWGVVVRPGKPENNAGDIVLSIRRKAPRSLKSFIQELGHRRDMT